LQQQPFFIFMGPALIVCGLQLLWSSFFLSRAIDYSGIACCVTHLYFYIFMKLCEDYGV